MTRSGRPRVGERISVRLPDQMLAELDARAATAGVTRAEAVRTLLHRAMGTGADDGVDRSQIAHRLRMTPAQRVRTMADEARKLLALASRAS